MIHTLTITHRIISFKVFNEIYKELDRLGREKEKRLYTTKKGMYVSKALVEDGFTSIILKAVNVDKKYKYKYMQVSITLNPTKLLKKNKLELTHLDDIEKIKEVFYENINKIHNSLPRFEYWIVNRIDYAININTPYVKEYIKLFHRADKPKGFNELYCTKSKKRKQLDGSFYLVNNSVCINFYDKENERLKENFNQEGAKNLLRLEVQCKKPKTNTLKVKHEFDSRHLGNYLSEEISLHQIEYYYRKTIGSGDYYKLSEAIKLVKESNYTFKTKEKLISVLKAVNKHRSIWRAREESEYNNNCFNRYLKQIRDLGINPVTIPSRWEVNKLSGDIWNNRCKIKHI